MSSIKDRYRYTPSDTERYMVRYEGEVLILQGYPCVNLGRCSFCTFCTDNSCHTASILKTNEKAIEKLTGKWGHVRIYNSGSVFELPMATLLSLKKRISKLKIPRVITEAHWRYKYHFNMLRDFFGSDTEVIIRLGVETFNAEIREGFMHKGMGCNVKVDEIKRSTDAINLFVGFKGQSQETVENDLQIALNNFNYIWLDIADPWYMCPRLIDVSLIKWFLKEGIARLCVPVHRDYSQFNERNYSLPFVLMYPSVSGTWPHFDGIYCDENCSVCLRNPQNKVAKIHDFVIHKKSM